VVPGTLNVRLPSPFDPHLATAYVASSEIDPGWEAATGQAGYRMVRVLVAGRYRGVAFQADEADEADEPGYPEDQLEIICEVHIHSELALADGDSLTPHAAP
jgi:CTP-dependent riboflavin kinase